MGDSSTLWDSVCEECTLHSDLRNNALKQRMHSGADHPESQQMEELLQIDVPIQPFPKTQERCM